MLMQHGGKHINCDSGDNLRFPSTWVLQFQLSQQIKQFFWKVIKVTLLWPKCKTVSKHEECYESFNVMDEINTFDPRGLWIWDLGWF